MAANAVAAIVGEFVGEFVGAQSGLGVLILQREAQLGASTQGEWETMVATASKSTNNPQLAQQIGSLNNVFTNELIDEINNFDKAAIERQARDFRL